LHLYFMSNCAIVSFSRCTVLLMSQTRCTLADAWWFDYFVCQMIIAVSQLIGNSVIISEGRFTESLSIISSYASNDKAVQVRW